MSQHRSDHDVEIVSYELYHSIEAKLVASVSWLIAKVYGTNVPDVLISPCYVDGEGSLHLKPSVIYSLTSGELYCSAAASIFRDPAFLNQNHSVVLQALKRLGLDVYDHEKQDVTETILRQTAPFKEKAHLAFIDALMMTSVRETINIGQIVDTIKLHANVHSNEQPNSLEEALVLWMNKICFVLSCRFQMPTIPKIIDLYEDLCDGMCLAAVLSFYNGTEMVFHRICFNEVMSLADSMHNLHLVQTFCHRIFQPTIFHFGRCEDILYAHECLKINILIFVVELFLRVEEFSGAATSMMNSTDSLMTSKSFDSLKYRSCPTNVSNNGNSTPHDTTFADFALRTLDKNSPDKAAFSKTEDSSKPPSWAIRMKLQEKRRQIEATRGTEIGDKLQQKQQMSKEAFMKLYGKQTNQTASIRSPKRPLSALSSAESETDTVRSSDTDTAATMIMKTSIARNQDSDNSIKNNLILEISESIKDMKQQMLRLAEEQQQIQRQLASSINNNESILYPTSSASIMLHSPSHQIHLEHDKLSPCYWTDQNQTTNSIIKETSPTFIPPEPTSRKKYTSDGAAERSAEYPYDMTLLKSNLNGERSASPNNTVGYVIGEERKEEDVNKLKDAVVASALKRKAMLEKRFDEIENDSLKKNEEILRKEDIEREKKREKELHRQKIYDQYLKRKAEKEARDSTSVRPSTSNTRLNTTLTVRPVSQIIPFDETYTGELNAKFCEVMMSIIAL